MFGIVKEQQEMQAITKVDYHLLNVCYQIADNKVELTLVNPSNEDQLMLVVDDVPNLDWSALDTITVHFESGEVAGWEVSL